MYYNIYILLKVQNSDFISKLVYRHDSSLDGKVEITLDANSSKAQVDDVFQESGIFYFQQTTL